MTTTNRRQFIKTSAIAAAGATIAGRHVEAQGATLELTISGLCVLVEKPSGVDLLLPTAPAHIPELVHPNGTERIAKHTVSISGLPAGAVAVPVDAPCNAQKRWFANLNKLHPGATLVAYPEPNEPRQVSCVLPLTGGAIQMVVSNEKDVPGINGVWEMAWDSNKNVQVLVEVAKYSVAIAPGTVTVLLTPMNGGSPRALRFTAVAGQTLPLKISNEAAAATRNNWGVIQHFDHHAQIFTKPPANTPDPVSSTSCGSRSAFPLIAPTPALIKAIQDFRAKGGRAGGQPDSVQIGTQRFFFTADDPICPIGHFKP